MTSTTAVPAVEGLLRVDDGVASLIGGRCLACGTTSFPAQRRSCPSPACRSADVQEVSLSRTGRVWSFTDARYQPPPPYVAAEPYQPFAIVAVELADEQLVVLGQVAEGFGVEDLAVGMEVEVVAETLFSDGDHDRLTGRWKRTEEEA